MNTVPGTELKEFNCLYKEMDDLYHDLALKSGTSDSAFSILYTIVELGDGCLQKDITEWNHISRQTVNSSVKNLQAKGYLSLKHGERRDMHIYLTPSGQRFVEEHILPIIQMENNAFSEMSPEESRELLRLTKKYVGLFRQKVHEFL